MKLEEVEKEKNDNIKFIILAFIIAIGMNECTYRVRVSLYDTCIADEADDVFVNYNNCGRSGEAPRP